MLDLNLFLKLLAEFHWLGNWLFLILAFIESAPLVGIFIPGSTLISIGGFLSAQGYLRVVDIIIFATIGAIVGDFFSYSVGRWGGDYIKRKKIISPSLLKHGEDFFRRYGNKSVFFGRFFGPIRAVIPFIAGLSKMKQRPFIFWNVLSAIPWAILNVLLGYFSGTLIVLIFKRWSGRLGATLSLLFLGGLIYWLIKKRGQSIIVYFRTQSRRFTSLVRDYTWFIDIAKRYPVINDFFVESKYAAEKLFGTFISLVFLIFIYILIIIFDIF